MTFDMEPVVKVSQTCIPSNGSVILSFTLEKGEACDNLCTTVYVLRNNVGCKNSHRLVPCHVKNASKGGVVCEMTCPCLLDYLSCEIVFVGRSIANNETPVEICEINF